MRGREPWDAMHEVFDIEVVNAIAKGKIDQADDLDVAQALARLVHDELRAYGTDSTNKLNDEQLADALKALRAVLHRVGVTQPPFRDFSTFHDYRSREGMGGSGGWGMRRGYLSELGDTACPRGRGREFPGCLRYRAMGRASCGGMGRDRATTRHALLHDRSR